MRLERRVAFDVPTRLACEEAKAFVRDVPRTLADAEFLTRVDVDEHGVVTALLPVNAALFGHHHLRFRSQLVVTEHGARLDGLELDDRPGWARVDGVASVAEHDGGNHLHYVFDIEIHLQLPEAERWGGRALLKMIEVTADQVLRRVTEQFPVALTSAARAYEADRAA